MTDDIPTRIAGRVQRVVRNPDAASALATELSVFYYALASWGRAREVPEGAVPFTYHRQSGLAVVFAALLMAAVAEIIPVHFLLRVASPVAAWIFTAIGIFGAIWVIGYLRTVIQRPVLVYPDAVHVRTGIQWSVRIPLDTIATLEVGLVKAPGKEATDALRAVKFGTPNALLTLREPLRAAGMYGKDRHVRVVALTLDDRAGFERAVTERLSARARAAAQAG